MGINSIILRNVPKDTSIDDVIWKDHVYYRDGNLYSVYNSDSTPIGKILMIRGRPRGIKISVYIGAWNTKPYIVYISRIIWILHNGPIPNGNIISYKDKDVTNTDINNLYLTTISEKSATSSGVRAVPHVNGVDRYEAKISYKNKAIYFGTYDIESDAKLVIDVARAILFGRDLPDASDDVVDKVRGIIGTKYGNNRRVKPSKGYKGVYTKTDRYYQAVAYMGGKIHAAGNYLSEDAAGMAINHLYVWGGKPLPNTVPISVLCDEDIAKLSLLHERYPLAITGQRTA